MQHSKKRSKKRSKPYKKTAKTRRAIKKLHAQGWSDSDIAKELGRTRSEISRHRRNMKLASNAFNERHIQKIRDATKQQCLLAGARTLKDIELLSERLKVAKRGFPAHLRPRECDVLEALEAGPKTRREICDALGLQWRGIRRSLKSRSKGGTWLSGLMHAGLVTSRRRYSKQYQYTTVYELTPAGEKLVSRRLPIHKSAQKSAVSRKKAS